MTARRWILLGGGLVLLLVALFSQIEMNVPSRPTEKADALAELRERGDLNVVFILIDTLRADRLSAYGYERPTSPTLADIAASGVRFAHVESQSSWTKCSMASLWTGLFPHRTGVVRFQHALPETARLPAEIFREAGYTTAGIFRNGWVGPNFGFSQGFDLYLEPAPRSEPKNFKRPALGARRLAGTDQDLTLAAIEFVHRNQNRKFFLYTHFMDVHQYAYDDEAAALGFGASLSDAYDASIHWVDANIYALLRALDEAHLLEKTLVVVAADHGEAFREHGREGHAVNIYREVTEVPLIFMLPFRLSEPLVVEPLVRNVDVWPTILDLAGLPPLPQTDGVSLVPLMQAAAEAKAPKTPVSMAYIDQTWGQIEEEPSPLVSIREDGQRILYRTRNPEFLEVFDHASDPKEQKNLFAENPEWVGPLKAELERRLTDPVPWGKATEVDVDAMERGQLRALGYVIPPGPPRPPGEAPPKKD
jgi:arylsulfatase A-like enzyme